MIMESFGSLDTPTWSAHPISLRKRFQNQRHYSQSCTAAKIFWSTVAPIRADWPRAKTRGARHAIDSSAE